MFSFLFIFKVSLPVVLPESSYQMLCPYTDRCVILLVVKTQTSAKFMYVFLCLHILLSIQEVIKYLL
jgi:hypothetical protein